MKKTVDLLRGPIAIALIKLALPIMGTSFIQMAYNLTDMLWIGKLGSNAVAAVGAAGMYSWFSSGFAMIARIGGQVMLGQSLGAGDQDKASSYASAALQMGIGIGVIWGAICLFFRGPLIAFYTLKDPGVVAMAEDYLLITGGLAIFNFLNQIFTGLLTSMGNSMYTFRSTTTGLVTNMILDPLLIFGIGPLPTLGVKGAAYATIIAQVLVFSIYFSHARKEPILSSKKYLLRIPSLEKIWHITAIGFPAAVQSIAFSAISMTVSRIIARWGAGPLAVQKVGSQIESISWLTAEGFASAVNSFTAQNFGANSEKRVREGYRKALLIIGSWGLFTTFILTVFPKQLFSLFIREPDVIPVGINFIRILGATQFFVCLENAATGVFQGLGNSMPPSLNGIVFNVLRVPGSLLLSSTALGLNGIWWTVSLSCLFKGIVLPLWLAFYMRKVFKKKRWLLQNDANGENKKI